MRPTGMDLERVFNKMVERKANPDLTPVKGMGNRMWTRTHPLKCPICKCVFFGYELADAPFEPYVQSMPEGKRSTCGHPRCANAEMDTYFLFNLDYQSACHKKFNPVQEEQKVKPLKTGLTRLGR